MTTKRRAIPLDIKTSVLHESGYKCANPVCRTIITLDIHHIVRVADDGGDSLDNLLALCPNCHALFHRGEILQQSIRTWKMLLLALNEAFDRQTIDILLALHKQGTLFCTGDAFKDYAALIAVDMVDYHQFGGPSHKSPITPVSVSLTAKGKQFIEAWKKGDQRTAITLPNYFIQLDLKDNQ